MCLLSGLLPQYPPPSASLLHPAPGRGWLPWLIAPPAQLFAAVPCPPAVQVQTPHHSGQCPPILCDIRGLAALLGDTGPGLPHGRAVLVRLGSTMPLVAAGMAPQCQGARHLVTHLVLQLFYLGSHCFHFLLGLLCSALPVLRLAHHLKSMKELC